MLFAAAELAPIARVGGMAEASAGLLRQLRADGLDVEVALPDYGGVELADETVEALDGPHWASPMSIRSGVHVDDHDLRLTLIDTPGMAKPHPYNDPDGQAFGDNDLRFLGFSAALAELANRRRPDVVHLNDWHTAAMLGFATAPPPSLLTIHTLGYQGLADPRWLGHLARSPESFMWYGDINPLLGGIRLADRVVTVSPNYASEILTEAQGMGLHHHLAARGDDLVGIINGIDTAEWDPATDPFIAANFSVDAMRGKSTNRAELAKVFGLSADGLGREPIIGMVGRLVEQKGIDLLVGIGRFLETVPARLVVLGSGDAGLVHGLHELAQTHPGRVGFRNDYDAALGHLIFAGADLLAMPSRFEPCGLAQMQAMAYGTIPVVTAVGGLVDTVVDDDRYPDRGNGFVSTTVDQAGLIDAVHRAARGWASTRRRAAIRRRGMSTDWSWTEPARRYQDLYRAVIADPA